MSKRNEEIKLKGQSQIPKIYSAQEFYDYFRTLFVTSEDSTSFSLKTEEQLAKDMRRTEKGNLKFHIDYKTGKNSLYNVLYAYAHYDPALGYGQGMNIIASWFLKFLQEFRPKNTNPQDEEEEKEEDDFVYNEVDTFFCMVYFYSAEGLNWRDMNQEPFPKLV
jgi:hypothetical protein